MDQRLMLPRAREMASVVSTNLSFNACSLDSHPATEQGIGPWIWIAHNLSHPAQLAPTSSRYRRQKERILRTRLGSTGSLVWMWIAKRCGPPIPSCMVNSVETSVSPPGARVVEPTTASGGQQPSMASIRGTTARRRG